MNTIIKIYIYNVHTHETIQSNQNIEKSSSGKSSFKLSVCVMILYGPFSYKLILTVPIVSQFLGLIPQSSIIKTQTVINIQLYSCWKVEVSRIKIFQISFTLLLPEHSIIVLSSE